MSTESISHSALVAETVERQRGVIFARPTIVWRNTYQGSGLFAAIASDDARGSGRPGYSPVEWWVMSDTAAENESPVRGEGVTELCMHDGTPVPLDALAQDRSLFGEARGRWPLIKILDIGGDPVVGDSGRRERPPIPPHVHAGSVEGGGFVGEGKFEAYFFPPIERPDAESPRITRIGLREEVGFDQLLEAAREFGRSDAAYWLLNEFEMQACEGWTVPAGVVHAPGPWPTVEMQTPQDDFNLLGWQLGARLSGEQLEAERERSQLRGLTDLETLLRKGVDFSATGRGASVRQNWRPPQSELVAEGVRAHRAFVSPFEGDYYELEPGARFTLPAATSLQAFFVWQGRGRANGQELADELALEREFLVAPDHSLALEAGSQAPGLRLLRFGPMTPAA